MDENTLQIFQHIHTLLQQSKPCLCKHWKSLSAFNGSLKQALRCSNSILEFDVTIGAMSSQLGSRAHQLVKLPQQTFFCLRMLLAQQLFL